MSKAFLDRYAKVFGRPSAMMLRISGLNASEYRGSGVVIVDEAGQEWLDFGSFGLHLLGHRHPHVVAAAERQLGLLGLSSKILANVPALDCAERLSALAFGKDRAGVLFGNSGSEAVEIAIKLARLTTGRRRFLALSNSYHGRTDGALQLSQTYARHAGAPDNGLTAFVDPGDLEGAARVLSGNDIAAVFVEPIQGEGGINPIAADFLQGLRRLSRAHGALLVSDEIQTGLGRGGDLVTCRDADIILFGKILAGGLVPVSAAVFRADVVGSKARDPVTSASSYAGGALAGAVGGAVLDVVTGPGFLDALSAQGARFRQELADGLSSTPGIRDVRGAGLMIGIACQDAQMAGEILLEAARHRLLLSFCLSAPHVLRVYPPVVASPEQMTVARDILVHATEVAWRRIHGEVSQTEPMSETPLI